MPMVKRGGIGGVAEGGDAAVGAGVDLGAGRAAGGVPRAIGDAWPFRRPRARGVSQFGGLGQQQGGGCGDRADVGEGRSVERVGPGSAAGHADQGNSAQHGCRCRRR